MTEIRTMKTFTGYVMGVDIKEKSLYDHAFWLKDISNRKYVSCYTTNYVDITKAKIGNYVDVMGLVTYEDKNQVIMYCEEAEFFLPDDERVVRLLARLGKENGIENVGLNHK